MNLTDTDTHGGIGNDLAEWFPLVEATGVPVPRTVIIDIGPTLFEDMLDDLKPRPETVAVMTAAAAAVEEVGAPAFMRTGEMSGKHSWDKTCFVRAAKRVPGHLYALVHNQAGAIGAGDPSHFVIREFLPTEPAFFAFDGMPVTRERRYFVRDGSVYDHHEYWPEAAIVRPRTADGTPLDDSEWKPLLRALSLEPRHEVEELTALTERAAAGLKGAWSVDWLWTSDRGWVFIDAAHAELSYTIPAVQRAASSRDNRVFAFDDESVEDAIAAVEALPPRSRPADVAVAALSAARPQVVAELNDLAALMQSSMTATREANQSLAYADQLFGEVVAWLEIEQLRRPTDENLDHLAAIVLPYS